MTDPGTGRDRDRDASVAAVRRPFRAAGLDDLVRAVLLGPASAPAPTPAPAPAPADDDGHRDVPTPGANAGVDESTVDESTFLARVPATGRLRPRALTGAGSGSGPGPVSESEPESPARGRVGWPSLPHTTHPPAFRVERVVDGAVVDALALRYPPREPGARPGSGSGKGTRLARADARALGVALTETALTDVAVVETATGALVAAAPDALAAARARHGDRLVVDDRRLLAPDPLVAGALAGYDPGRALDHAVTYDAPAPADLFRVEAHPKGWALAHQPEVSRVARSRERARERARERERERERGDDGS